MVIICINHFIKLVQLVPFHASKINTMADKFLSIVISQHRLSECIISDCDPCFCVHFWDELMSLLDIRLTFIIASYPQTNGMAEVINYTMEQLLKINVQ